MLEPKGEKVYEGSLEHVKEFLTPSMIVRTPQMFLDDHQNHQKDPKQLQELPKVTSEAPKGTFFWRNGSTWQHKETLEDSE